MRCEVCGGKIYSKPYRAIIEGAKLLVCEECASHGSSSWKVTEEKKPPFSSRKIGVTPSVSVKNPVSAYKEVEEYVLVENYGAKIKKAREKLGWSQEDLGLKVNEKASLIGKIETEKFVPSNVITRKLEHILGITLLTKEPSIAVPKSSKTQPQELTLGDVVIIKKREKNIGGRQDSSG